MPRKKPLVATPAIRHSTSLTRRERIAVLIDMLDERQRGSPQGVTVPAWLARLGSETRHRLPSDKTLRRDAATLAKTLRDQHGGKEVLTFDPKTQSWSLAFPVSCSTIEVPTCLSLVRTDAVVTTLFLAMRAAEQFSHTPLAQPMRAMLDQMAGELPATQRKRLERLAGQIHFTGPAFHALAPEIFEPLLKALDHKRKVEVAYRNLRGEDSRRTLSPLGLVVVDRAWHVVAEDSQSGSVRSFRLSRILEAQLTEASFAPPKDFDLQIFLDEGFGGLGHTGVKAQEVVLRFTPEGVAAACDDVRWHPTQKRKTLQGGGVELRFKTTALFQVVHQVMAYAGFVEVAAPRELREEVRRRAGALAKMHG